MINEVRTFTNDAGKRIEVVGVPCEVTTTFYKISLTTPALANIPSLGSKTPNARVSCTHKGNTASFVAKPHNLTKLEEIQGSQYLGVVGVLVASAAAEATIDEDASVYTYQSFWVNVDYVAEN